ncbi:MAG: hypothetical protein ACUVQR_08975 [Thermogutta sp.]
MRNIDGNMCLWGCRCIKFLLPAVLVMVIVIVWVSPLQFLVASEWVPRGKQIPEGPPALASGDRLSQEVRLTSHVGSQASAPSQFLRWLPVTQTSQSGTASTAGELGATSKDLQTGGEQRGEIIDSPKEPTHAENIAVVLEAPLVDGSESDIDDPLQDPFGDMGRPNASRPPQALLPLPSFPQVGGQSGGAGQLEIVPPPPPLTTQSKLGGPGLQPQGGAPQALGPQIQPTVENEKRKSPQELLEGLPPAPEDKRPMEEQLVQAPPLQPDECPPFGRRRSISEITNDISAKPGKLPTECPLGDGEFAPRQWEPIVFTWKASGLCHKPLYFEQVAVERYGHNLGPILQHVAAGTHFFLTIPILPYKMGLNPPDECIYPLGYYRPGSCAPWILDPIPLSVRAALAEGGIWTGMAFLIP